MSAMPAVNENAVLEVLRSRAVHTYFQPVVSLASRSIVGFEAFSRGGTGEDGGREIEPSQLFHRDLGPETKVDVDRLCRESALAQFKPIHEAHGQLLLFVNLNSDILPHVDLGTKMLMRQVCSMDIDMDNVVVELPMETALSEEVARFAELYRNMGVKICLDNCVADARLERAVAAIRPSYVKLSPSLYDGETDTEALRRVMDNLKRMGVLVAAQGVESEENALRLMAAGVHLQQGYYYSRDEGDSAKSFSRKLQAVHDKYIKVGRALVRRKKERLKTAFRTVGTVCSRLSAKAETRFEDVCRDLVRSTEDVISVFVLNERGVQITARSHAEAEGKTKGGAGVGSARGTDHSVYDYFMYLDMGYEKFVTPPFLSPFTGKNARLISRSIYNSEGARYVVCVEVIHPE